MTRLDLDGDIDSRINDLILRGLEAYGQGDVTRAMSFWRHALALDPDSEIAQSYVAYVKRHFHVADELPASDPFASAETEHEVPYGLVTMRPTEPFDFEAYARLAASESTDDAGDPRAPLPAEVAEVADGADEIDEIDEGWSLASGEFEVADFVKQRRENPAPRPTYDIQSLSEIDDIATGNLADALEPGDDLAEQLAAVSEGLLIAESGAIDARPVPAPTSAAPEPEPPTPQLEPDPLVPDPELVAAVAGKDPKATVYGYQPTIKPSTATLQGLPEPDYQLGEPEAPPLELEAQPPLEVDMFAQPGSFSQGFGDEAQRELHADNTPDTADIPAPPPLSEDLELELELEIDAGPAGGGPELPDLTLDLGPAPNVEATPPPPELGRPGAPLRRPLVSDNLGLDLELGKAGTSPRSGDVQISFHHRPEPAPGDIPLGLDHGDELELQLGGPGIDGPALDSLQVAGSGGLEEQLAELEVEMETGVDAFEWQTHDTNQAPGASAPGAPADTSLAALADQIRAAVDRQAVPGEAPIDRLRRRIGGFIERAATEIRRDNLSIAAIAADLALSEEPDSATAQKLIHQSHGVLVEVFRAYLGSLDGVPAVGLPMHEIPMQELDHRTAFLLSRIDGTLSFEDILDVSGMPRLEALRYLCRLRLQGILEVR